MLDAVTIMFGMTRKANKMAYKTKHEQLQNEIESITTKLDLAKGTLYDIHKLVILGFDNEDKADTLFRAISAIIMQTSDWIENE